MTWEELEKGIQEVKDQLLVSARLMERYERQSNDRMERLETLALRHEERLGNVEERYENLQASMQALFERMDRFIRGLEGNGKGGMQ